MTDPLFKKQTEVRYEVRTVNSDGDVEDVAQQWSGRGSKGTAMKWWRRWNPADYEVSGFVLERLVETGCQADGVDERTYTTLASKGNAEILAKGGWLSEDNHEEVTT